MDSRFGGNPGKLHGGNVLSTFLILNSSFLIPVERYLVKRGLDRLILLPIVLSVLYAAVLLWQLTRMIGEGDWIEHTTSVMALASDAQRHVQFQESALR